MPARKSSRRIASIRFGLFILPGVRREWGILHAAATLPAGRQSRIAREILAFGREELKALFLIVDPVEAIRAQQRILRADGIPISGAGCALFFPLGGALFPLGLYDFYLLIYEGIELFESCQANLASLINGIRRSAVELSLLP